MTFRLLLLIACCALLWSLESLIPLFSYGQGRLRRAVPNVVLAVILILTNVVLAFLTAWVSGFVLRHRVGLSFFTDLPLWADVILGVTALDLSGWIAHVLMHKSRLGWRFHRVHHSEEEVDVTTAFRQHPGESVWRVLWQLPPIVAFGLPLWIVVFYLMISSLNAQLEHANVRVLERWDRLIRFVFVTPNMHKVHHSRMQSETDSNYSNIFSLWDRLFGTYTRGVDVASVRYGLDGLGDASSQSLPGLLILPFRRGGT